MQVEACAESRRDGGAQDFETSRIFPGGAATQREAERSSGVSLRG